MSLQSRPNPRKRTKRRAELISKALSPWMGQALERDGPFIPILEFLSVGSVLFCLIHSHVFKTPQALLVMQAFLVNLKLQANQRRAWWHHQDLFVSPPEPQRTTCSRLSLHVAWFYFEFVIPVCECYVLVHVVWKRYRETAWVWKSTSQCCFSEPQSWASALLSSVLWPENGTVLYMWQASKMLQDSVSKRGKEEVHFTWLLRMSRARCCSSITSRISFRVLRPNANRDCCSWPIHIGTYAFWATGEGDSVTGDTRREKELLPQTECFSSRSSLMVTSHGMVHVSQLLIPPWGFWPLTGAAENSSLAASDSLKLVPFPVSWQWRENFQ